MRHIQEHTEQKTSGTVSPRQKLSILGRATALALLGMALVYWVQFFIVWFALGIVLLPVLVFAIVTLLVVGLVAARLRWAPVLGVLVALVTSTIMLIVPGAISTLLHPAANLVYFGTLIALFACALAVIVVGAATTIQNYHSGDLPTPRWLSPLLSGLVCLVVGMIVVAATVAAHPQGSPMSTTTNGMPTAHMAGSNFLTNVVLVPKGEKLLLVDDDSVEHIIQSGMWTKSGTPQPQAEPGAPPIRNLDIKGRSVEIGPFNTAGVFHLYCTIHRGMNLTVVVQ